MAQLLGVAFPKAFPTGNISSGFRRPRISPLNRNAFSDDEFLGSYVTDRPAPALMPPPTDQPVPSTSGSTGPPEPPND